MMQIGFNRVNRVWIQHGAPFEFGQSTDNVIIINVKKQNIPNSTNSTNKVTNFVLIFMNVVLENFKKTRLLRNFHLISHERCPFL